LFAIRRRALLELEKARQGKIIGKSLDAQVAVHLFKRTDGAHTPTDYVSQWTSDLRELLNVSSLEILRDIEFRKDMADDEILSVAVGTAPGQKCARCWHFETDVGTDPQHPTICARCVEAVKQAVSV
jgi:isoleucyl-tRNA synthetase